MSSLTLDDLINEKKKNNGMATEEAAATVEQPKEEPKKEEEKPVEKRTAPNFDKMELKEVKVSDFAKTNDNGKSLEQENMDRLLHELDEGIEAAKKRRFQPAIDEINRAREEYALRKEAGEENPQVNIKSTVGLELDPNYTDDEVETIKEENEFAETICSGLKYMSEYRYVIETPDTSKIIAYFKISTADNENYLVDFNYCNGYDIDCETILYFATREILKRKRRFKLHIKMKNYLNTNKQQEEYFNQSDFHCLNTKLLLVKDFFKPVKEYSEEERFAVLGGLHNSPTF